MADFVAYYRVSTDRQGASGLGLDAQRQAVARQVNGGQLVAEFTEIESGRRHTNRPQLLAALEECRKRRATLLIARLDRLARNVAFIANLMESGADVGTGRASCPPASAGGNDAHGRVAEPGEDIAGYRPRPQPAQYPARKGPRMVRQ